MSSAAEYWVGPTIGEGAFGHVVYAVHKATERKVAIKVIEIPNKIEEHRLHHQNQLKQKTAMILNERKILSLPDLKSSRWIVNLWAFFCDSSSIYFVLELATGGDLNGLIRSGLHSSDRCLWRRFSIPRYASQLISAVDFLHNKGIVHCDLQPGNVLLDGTSGNLKLADFGCAINRKKHNPEHQQSSYPRGTSCFASPELIRAASPSTITVAVDYWSIGCIIHAMWHGSSPFDRSSEALTVAAIFRYIDRRKSDIFVQDEIDKSEYGVSNGSKTTYASLDRNNEDNIIEDDISRCPWNEMTSTEARTDKRVQDVPDLLQVISQDLLAAIPEDRINTWTNKAIPFLVLYKRDIDPSDDNDGQPSLVSKNILLPVPSWSEDVANTMLRDGNLGWSVFQI